jgi:Glycosyl transferases group 1
MSSSPIHTDSAPASSRDIGRSGVRLNAELAACTIIAKNYLPMARVLAESFQKRYPAFPFIVLFLDSTEALVDRDSEPFFSLEAGSLPIPNLPGLLFKYNVLEASTAVKPYLLEHLFSVHNFPKLLYLDPDILITAELPELLQALDRFQIVLTPHIMSPYGDDKSPSDLDILRAGSYNLGFIGLRNTEVTARLIRWWQSKVYHHCLHAVELGLFVDQRWMDMVPSLFESVHVLRHPGYNVAYWNLHERKVEFRGDDIFVNGEACRFFHFSGFDPYHPERVSKHQNRFTWKQIGEARKLFQHYRELLLSKGWATTHKWRYSYDYFENGWKIPEEARRYYWSLGEDVAELGNPFGWMNGSSGHAAAQEATEAARIEKLSSSAPFGINIVGYIRSEKGVGEGLRSNVRALKAADVPYVLIDFEDTGSANVEEIGQEITNQDRFPVNLINVNADQVPYFAQRKPDLLDNHYNIGFWNWEVSDFPPEWRSSFDYLDEVWVPSSFTQKNIAAVSPIPVHRVPYTIDPEIEPPPHWTRKNFGFSQRQFVFLFIFDFLSFAERKNPAGTIAAFKRAFGSRKDVLLFIKGSHAEAAGPLFRRLQQEAAGASIVFSNEILSRDAIHGLISSCDCFVSLHRAEGFGFTLAEAMNLAKPVIATSYSSNMDFMDEQSSFLVPYKLIEIERHHGPYKKGYVWADPDLDHAAALMQQIVAERDAAARVALAGQRLVRERLHPRVSGEIIRKRLAELPLDWQVSVA